MYKHIPLKWTDEEYKYFNKKIPVVERVNWLDRIFDGIEEWFIYFAIVVMAGAAIWIFINIYQLSRISIY